MLYEINFSKYINEKFPDYWLFNKIKADSEEEAIEILKKKHNKNNKKVNYIISICIVEWNNDGKLKYGL